MFVFLFLLFEALFILFAALRCSIWETSVVRLRRVAVRAKSRVIDMNVVAVALCTWQSRCS